MCAKTLQISVFFLFQINLIAGLAELAEAQMSYATSETQATDAQGGSKPCKTNQDCDWCVEVCLNIPSEQLRCVPSGRTKCEDGRCESSPIACGGNCKRCAEKWDYEQNKCVPRDGTFCPVTGECVYGNQWCENICWDSNRTGCNCKQACVGFIFPGCVEQDSYKDRVACPDGSCVDPQKGEKCNKDCAEKQCAYCTQMCVDDKCVDSHSHICPDMSCRAISDQCPQSTAGLIT